MTQLLCMKKILENGALIRSGWFFCEKTFIIRKCHVWRLSDFLSLTNLPGISVEKPKFCFRFQKFTSNDEEWGVKLQDGYKINQPQNCNFEILLAGVRKDHFTYFGCSVCRDFSFVKFSIINRILKLITLGRVMD